MKKILILIFLFCFSIASHAAIPGLPFKDYEYAHFFSGAYVSTVLRKANIGKLETAGTLFVLSIAKEMIDSNRTGFLISDIGFCMSGVLISFTIDDFLEKNMVK